MNRRQLVTRGSLGALVGAVPGVLAHPAVKQQKEGKFMVDETLVPHTSIHRIDADGVTVFPLVLDSKFATVASRTDGSCWEARRYRDRATRCYLS